MVTRCRREILTYDEDDGFYYQITSNTDINNRYSCGNGKSLKVAISKQSWQDWQKRTATAEFDVIAGKDIGEEVLSKLTYLTLIGAKIGYEITEILVNYDHVFLELEHRSLSELNRYLWGGTGDLVFGDDHTVGFEFSLPTNYLVRLYALPADNPLTMPTLTVEAPRLKRKQNDKIKWRKFVISEWGTLLVEERRKKYLRKIKFLEPTKEQHAAGEQPVEICESYL